VEWGALDDVCYFDCIQRVRRLLQLKYKDIQSLFCVTSVNKVRERAQSSHSLPRNFCPSGNSYPCLFYSLLRSGSSFQLQSGEEMASNWRDWLFTEELKPRDALMGWWIDSFLFATLPTFAPHPPLSTFFTSKVAATASTFVPGIPSLQRDLGVTNHTVRIDSF